MTDPRARHTAAFWDERYRDRQWSGRPNAAVVDQVSDLAPGTALDVGAGEGGDALWLAEQGWRVIATDVSGVGLGRAEGHTPPQLADALSWRVLDVFAWDPLVAPDGAFDLVLVAFLLHLAASERGAVIDRLAAAVAVGGRLLIVNHDASDLATSVPRPPEPERFPPVDELAGHLDDGWEVETATTRPRTQADPEGREVTVHDAVLRARRRT